MVLEDTTSTAVQFANTQTSNFTSTNSGPVLASYLRECRLFAGRQIGESGYLNTIGFGLYVSTWRARAWTINIGVRYDYNSPPVNKYGLGNVPDHSSGNYYCVPVIP